MHIFSQYLGIDWFCTLPEDILKQFIRYLTFPDQVKPALELTGLRRFLRKTNYLQNSQQATVSVELIMDFPQVQVLDNIVVRVENADQMRKLFGLEHLYVGHFLLKPARTMYTSKRPRFLAELQEFMKLQLKRHGHNPELYLSFHLGRGRDREVLVLQQSCGWYSWGFEHLKIVKEMEPWFIKAEELKRCDYYHRLHYLDDRVLRTLLRKAEAIPETMQDTLSLLFQHGIASPRTLHHVLKLLFGSEWMQRVMKLLRCRKKFQDPDDEKSFIRWHRFYVKRPGHIQWAILSDPRLRPLEEQHFQQLLSVEGQE